ncbi:MAG TPA: hypothetical protein VE973_03210 [Candidatus Limnocylindria bacterium]|nr:hypothetical protein [Candidatus Limnocylindria bacterium]
MPTLILKNNSKKNNQQGYIVLMALIIISAVALATVLLTINRGATISSSGQAAEQSAQARALANACAEYALQELKDDQNYPGNTTVPLEMGSCSLLPITQSGTTFTIQAQGIVSSMVRKVLVTAEIINQAGQVTVTLDSWQEVSDF